MAGVIKEFVVVRVMGAGNKARDLAEAENVHVDLSCPEHMGEPLCMQGLWLRYVRPGSGVKIAIDDPTPEKVEEANRHLQRVYPVTERVMMQAMGDLPPAASVPKVRTAIVEMMDALMGHPLVVGQKGVQLAQALKGIAETSDAWCAAVGLHLPIDWSVPPPPTPRKK